MAPMPSPGLSSTGRFDGIDFWRGLVLCTIFINHVPGNPLERLTHKNLGFSDSAEAFVFLSGLSLALAHGGRFAAGARLQVVHRLAHRAVTLYGVHLFLSLAGLAIFAIGADLVDDPGLMAEHGRDLFNDDPRSALVGIASLGHQLGYFNILPVYVVLVAFVPALLWLAGRGSAVMLAASLGLYAAARLAQWNIPTWPMQGTWFLNPFAWQVLLAGGIAVGLGLRAGGVPRSRSLAGLAAAVVGAGAVCATDGLSFWPGLEAGVHRWADLDKTSAGLGRLVHFAATAYLAWWLGLASALRGSVPHRMLCLLGRQGLWAFGCLSLLAAAGQVVTRGLGDAPGGGLLTVVGGLALLFGLTLLVEMRVAQRDPPTCAKAS